MNEPNTENTQNQIISILKKNSKYIISIIIVIFFTLITLYYLDHKKKEKNVFISNQFNKAQILIDKKQRDNALPILLNIIEENNNFYSTLSLYLIIDEELEKNQSKIEELFNKILSNSEIEKENKNLIRIKKAIYLSNYDEEQKILDELKPIINSKSMWRKDALQFLFDYFSSRGENIKAKEYNNLLRSPIK